MTEASPREIGEALWNAVLQGIVPARAVVAWVHAVAETSGAAWAHDFLVMHRDLEDYSAPDDLLEIPGAPPDPAVVDGLILALAGRAWTEGRMEGWPLATAIERALEHRWRKDPEKKRILRELIVTYEDDREARPGWDHSKRLTRLAAEHAPFLERLPALLRDPWNAPAAPAAPPSPPKPAVPEGIPEWRALLAALRACFSLVSYYDPQESLQLGGGAHAAFPGAKGADRAALLEATFARDDELVWLFHPRCARITRLGDAVTRWGVYRLGAKKIGEVLEWRVAVAPLGAVDLATACEEDAAPAFVMDLARGRVVRIGAGPVALWARSAEAEWLAALAMRPPKAPPAPPSEERLAAARRLTTRAPDAPADVDLAWVDEKGRGFGTLWLLVGETRVVVCDAAAYRLDDYSGAEDHTFVAELFAGPDGAHHVALTRVRQVHYGERTESTSHFVVRAGATAAPVEAPLDDGWRLVGTLVSP